MKIYLVVSVFLTMFVVQSNLIRSFSVVPNHYEKPNDKGRREFWKLNFSNVATRVGLLCSACPHHQFQKPNKMQSNPTTANRAEAINALLTTKDEQILKEVRAFFANMEKMSEGMPSWNPVYSGQAFNSFLNNVRKLLKSEVNNGTVN